MTPVFLNDYTVNDHISYLSIRDWIKETFSNDLIMVINRLSIATKIKQDPMAAANKFPKHKHVMLQKLSTLIISVVLTKSRPFVGEPPFSSPLQN